MNKERRECDCYFSVPVMYAQMLTKTTVKQAPANPESIYLALKNAGKTDASAGSTYSAVRSAMIPAKNPSIATKTKTFNLSPIFFTLLLELKSKPLFSLTYIFLSIISKPATYSFI